MTSAEYLLVQMPQVFSLMQEDFHIWLDNDRFHDAWNCRIGQRRDVPVSRSNNTPSRWPLPVPLRREFEYLPPVDAGAEIFPWNAGVGPFRTPTPDWRGSVIQYHCKPAGGAPAQLARVLDPSSALPGAILQLCQWAAGTITPRLVK